MNRPILEKIINEVICEVKEKQMEFSKISHEIPIAISARHAHLKQEHVEILFGKGTTLTKKSDLLQPGQYAANETVMIIGPRGSIENVRVLGPARSETQIEISYTDSIKLGITPPIRESGSIQGSAGCSIVGPKGCLHLHEGVIIAQAHIHMSTADAETLNVVNGEIVAVRVPGVRPITFDHVVIRVSDSYILEMHIDTDEANAGFIKPNALGQLIKHQ